VPPTSEFHQLFIDEALGIAYMQQAWVIPHAKKKLEAQQRYKVSRSSSSKMPRLASYVVVTQCEHGVDLPSPTPPAPLCSKWPVMFSLPVPWYIICCETKLASRSSAFSIVFCPHKTDIVRHSRTNKAINLLAVYSLNSGVLTSVFAICDLAIVSSFPATLHFLFTLHTAGCSTLDFNTFSVRSVLWFITVNN
jgi:hypothetical protein